MGSFLPVVKTTAVLAVLHLSTTVPVTVPTAAKTRNKHGRTRKKDLGRVSGRRCTSTGVTCPPEKSPVLVRRVVDGRRPDVPVYCMDIYIYIYV